MDGGKEGRMDEGREVEQIDLRWYRKQQNDGRMDESTSESKVERKYQETIQKSETRQKPVSLWLAVFLPDSLNIESLHINNFLD